MSTIYIKHSSSIFEISSIDQENLDFSEGDELILSNPYTSFNITAKLIEIINPKTIKISISMADKIIEDKISSVSSSISNIDITDNITEFLKNYSTITRDEAINQNSNVKVLKFTNFEKEILTGKLTIKKLKQKKIFLFNSLKNEIISPSFSSINSSLNQLNNSIKNYLLYSINILPLKKFLYENYFQFFNKQKSFRQVSKISFNSSLCNDFTSNSELLSTIASDISIQNLYNDPVSLAKKLIENLSNKYNQDEMKIKKLLLKNHNLFFNLFLLFCKQKNSIKDSLKNLRKLNKDEDYAVNSPFFNVFYYENPSTVNIIGSLVSQEVLKSISSMYLPIQQWYFFESLSSSHSLYLNQFELNDDIEKVLSTSSNNSSVSNNTSNNSFSSVLSTVAPSLFEENQLRTNVDNIHVDPELLNELKGLRIFVVGAGALGSELIKTLSILYPQNNVEEEYLIDESENENENKENEIDNDDIKNGITSSISSILSSSLSHSLSLWEKFNYQEGGIIITDNDDIERSNLSRQLFFREEDVGENKSKIIKKKVKEINPNLKITALNLKLTDDFSNEFFNEKFWQQVDVVITALVRYLFYYYFNKFIYF